MTCEHCRCPADSPRVTLERGDEVSSWCPRWLDETGRRERDARACLALRTKPERHEMLASVRRSRGEEAARRVEAKVRELWAVRNGATA